MTVEKQNIGLEMKVTLRDILETANKAKSDLVNEVVIKILTRDGSMTAEDAQTLIGEVAPPFNSAGLGWVRRP